MTERDETGDSDGGRRPAAAGASVGDGPASDPDGRTQVISTGRTVPAQDRSGQDRSGQDRVGGAPPTAVHVPPQGGPPRADHGRPPAPPGYGAGPGYPPTQANPYGPGDGYGPPAYGAAPGAHPTRAYGAPAYGAPAGAPGNDSLFSPPVQGNGPGYPPAYGAAPAYGAGPSYGAPSYGAGPSYGPPGQPYPGAYLGAPSGPPGAVPPPPGFSAAPSGGRRRTVTLLVALVAVVALVAGGTIAWFSLRGGGGDTPTEAVALLADDLQGGDWSKAVTRLHPDEVALGGDLGTMLNDELVRLQVVKPDAEVSFTGTTFADLRFDDAAVETVRPNVAIAKLVGGTVTVDRNANNDVLTDEFKRLAYPGGVPPTRAPEVIDIAQVVAERGGPVRVATVEVDGDWYVSATYTLADAALEESRESWPQGTIAARGSATPQDAVRDAVSALFNQDVRRLVELAPPRELAVLHDVGPVLVEKAGSTSPTGRLVDIATTPSEVPGGTALAIDRIVVEDTSGSQVTVVRDGDCLAVTQSRSLGGPQRVCADDIARQSAGSVAQMTDPALRDIVTRATRAVLSLKVVVVEDGGQYYVSPVRSVVGLGIDVLRTLQPADLARLAALEE